MLRFRFTEQNPSLSGRVLCVQEVAVRLWRTLRNCIAYRALFADAVDREIRRRLGHTPPPPPTPDGP